MRPTQLAVLLVTVVAVSDPLRAVAPAGADLQPTRAPVRWNSPKTHQMPGLYHGSLASQAMGMEVGYNVFLPPSYTSNPRRRYPVIYFLHGSGGDENSDAAGFAGLVSKLVEAGKIPEVICVFPNGGLSGYRDHPDTKVMVETCIVDELCPLIDRTYRTLPERGARVVVGFSMGGGGALWLAVRHPDLFSAAGTWGAAFRGKHYDEIPPELTSAGLAAVSGQVRLRLVVGAEDMTLRAHPPFVQQLAAAKFPFALEVLPQVGHDLGAYYTRSGEAMLRFLTADFGAGGAPSVK